MSAPSTIKNAKGLIIGGTPSTGQTLTRLNSSTFVANTGEIGVFSPDGERLVGTGGTVVAGVSRVAIEGEAFVVAISRGASLKPLISDVIDNVSFAKSTAGSAASEQTLYVGYNGTSGDLSNAVANYLGELFSVKLIMQEFFSGTDAERIKAGYHQSLLTDDEIDIANGIVKSINMNFLREPKNNSGNPPVVAELLSAAAGTEALSASDTIVGTKGSTQLNITEIGGVLPYLFAVGDYIRLGTATTDDIYRITATTVTLADGGVLTLDRPLSADFSPAAGTGTTEYITAAQAAAASAGIKIEGQALRFDPEKARYTKTRFAYNVSESFGTSTVTNTDANKGNGTYEEVANLERFLIGYRSEQYRMGEPYLFNIQGSPSQILSDSAVAGGFYDSIDLHFSDKTLTSFQEEISPKAVRLVVPATTPTHITAANDGVSDTLETLIPASAISGSDLAL
jgi:hypothetical protein